MAERDALRYTPAGVPHLAFQLQHQSRQAEAGGNRDVEVVMSAVALGDPALVAAKLEKGQAIAVKGFLSRRSQRSDYPVLHISQIKLLADQH